MHVGVANWNGLRLLHAEEQTPAHYVDTLAMQLHLEMIDRVIMEGFWLRTGQPQGGSDFGMVELIGWTRHECRRRDIPFTLINATQTKATVARFRAEKIGLGNRKGPHVRDAVAVLLGSDKVPTDLYREHNP